MEPAKGLTIAAVELNLLTADSNLSPQAYSFITLIKAGPLGVPLSVKLAIVGMEFAHSSVAAAEV